jgi:hypothetical protein
MYVVILLVMAIPVVMGIRASRAGKSSGIGCCTVSDPRLDLRMRAAFEADGAVLAENIRD